MAHDGMLAGVGMVHGTTLGSMAHVIIIVYMYRQDIMEA